MDRHIVSRETGARHLQEQVRSIDAMNADTPGAAHRARANPDPGITDANEPAPAAASAENASPDDQAPSDVAQVDFNTLKLRPGMYLQAQSMAKSAVSYHAEFLGIIAGKGSGLVVWKSFARPSK